MRRVVVESQLEAVHLGGHGVVPEDQQLFVADSDIERQEPVVRVDANLTGAVEQILRLNVRTDDHVLLDENGLTIDDVDLMIPHQANLRINEHVAKEMGIPPEKVYHNIQRYGNTTAGSIPIALTEAIEEGKAKKGDTILLAAFGAGFTWASCLLNL